MKFCSFHLRTIWQRAPKPQKIIYLKLLPHLSGAMSYECVPWNVDTHSLSPRWVLSLTSLFLAHDYRGQQAVPNWISWVANRAWRGYVFRQPLDFRLGGTVGSQEPANPFRRPRISPSNWVSGIKRKQIRRSPNEAQLIPPSIGNSFYSHVTWPGRLPTSISKFHHVTAPWSFHQSVQYLN